MRRSRSSCCAGGVAWTGICPPSASPRLSGKVGCGKEPKRPASMASMAAAAAARVSSSSISSEASRVSFVRTWLDTFRARITVALFGFFLVPTLVFGWVAYRALAGEVARVAQTWAQYSVSRVVLEFQEGVADLPDLAAHAGTDVLRYINGELIAVSSREALDLGAADARRLFMVLRADAGGVRLLGGDEDLVSAVEAAQGYGARVHLWGIEAPEGRNQAEPLLWEVDSQRTLDLADRTNAPEHRAPPGVVGGGQLICGCSRGVRETGEFACGPTGCSDGGGGRWPRHPPEIVG